MALVSRGKANRLDKNTCEYCKFNVFEHERLPINDMFVTWQRNRFIQVCTLFNH